MKNRIELMDSFNDIIYKISEGNPGALTVLLRSMTEVKDVDPDCALENLGPALLLDTFGIYGSNIWILYKDCCYQDIHLFWACLRGLQLGLVTEWEINDAILKNGKGFEPKILLRKIREELPNFAKGFNEEEV